MKLIYHPRSPFSRIVSILAHELSLISSITLQKVVVCPVDPFPGWSDNNAEVAVTNPLAKIPTFVISDLDKIGLFDSRVICEYLEHLADESSLINKKGKIQKGSDLYFKHLAIFSAALGILDAEVLCTYEERIRKPAGVFHQPWYDGQKKKNARGMDFLNDMVRRGTLQIRGADEVVSTADIAVAVVCGSLDSKRSEWRKGREELAEYFDKTWNGRKSWLLTPVDQDWDKVGSGTEKL